MSRLLTSLGWEDVATLSPGQAAAWADRCEHAIRSGSVTGPAVRATLLKLRARATSGGRVCVCARVRS